MAKIKVEGKIDAGVHPVYGKIVKGREYEIDDDKPLPDQLFERVPTEGVSSPPAEKGESRKILNFKKGKE